MLNDTRSLEDRRAKYKNISKEKVYEMVKKIVKKKE